jgi:hypothetical protein
MKRCLGSKHQQRSCFDALRKFALAQSKHETSLTEEGTGAHHATENAVAKKCCKPCTGIFTDQCISSTVTFDVIVIEDGCAAGMQELHDGEIEIINMIYASVMSTEELIGYLP